MFSGYRCGYLKSAKRKRKILNFIPAHIHLRVHFTRIIMNVKEKTWNYTDILNFLVSRKVKKTRAKVLHAKYSNINSEHPMRKFL